MHDLFAEFESITPDLWITKEEAYTEKLLKLPNWSQIPLLNSNASHNLSDGTLVRFRGMIQDMHNPEFFFDSFEVWNSLTNECKIKSGKYRDTADVLEHEKVNYAENLKSSQRHTMVVVSIPGLNEWVQTLEDQQNHLKHLQNHPNTSRRTVQNNTATLKRSFDEVEDNAMEVAENGERSKEAKTNETVDNTSTVVSREHLLNFPLPDVSSKSCIVKTYEEENSLKVNDIIEVVGFLSVDPTLSGEFQPENNALLEPEIESNMEAITLNPPPSLVPRLHAVYVKKLDHCNPLIKEEFNLDHILKEAQTARDHLTKALTELLLGDRLAAEYLICQLIACIYLRQETLSLGQVCLNISNLPTEKYPEYGSKLNDILQQFVTKSYYLPLTIENLNTMAMNPQKDYTCNRLTSGMLQLGKHTHLILDETKLQQGRLDATGVKNLASLGHLIKTQKVEYDFKYYKMEFDSDVSVLTLSEGKSLLPSDYHVPLKPEESSLQIFEAIVEAATYYLKEDIMNIIRRYLTNMKMVKFTLNEDLKFVEDDFITLRSNATEENPFTADDLHRLLVLARLVSLSKGHDSLNKECWDTAMEMEKERLARVKDRVPANRV